MVVLAGILQSTANTSMCNDICKAQDNCGCCIIMNEFYIKMSKAENWKGMVTGWLVGIYNNILLESVVRLIMQCKMRRFTKWILLL